MDYFNLGEKDKGWKKMAEATPGGVKEVQPCGAVLDRFRPGVYPDLCGSGSPHCPAEKHQVEIKAETFRLQIWCCGIELKPLPKNVLRMSILSQLLPSHTFSYQVPFCAL